MSLSDEQKRIRSTALGASEIATIVGCGPGSLAQLWESKVQPAKDLEATLPMEFGIAMEQPIADRYAKDTGTFLAAVETLRHPTRPLIVATPDRARFLTEDARKAVSFGGPIDTIEALSGADRLVEIKRHAARFRTDYGPAGTGQVPEHEAIQTIIQMGVTGQRVADLAVLFQGDFGLRLEVFTIGWNEALFDGLCEAAERFWRDFVVTKKPPPPDGSDRYDEFLKRAFPVHVAPPVVATDSDEELMMRFAKFREVERRAEILKKKAAQQLKLRIGDAEGMISASLGKLVYKRTTDGSDVDWQKAAQESQALVGLCLNAFDVLEQTGEKLSPENRAALVARMKAIIPEATVAVPGYRSLRPYFKGAAALELARLEMALDALEDGT